MKVDDCASPMPEPRPRYHAFVSYSHAADGQLAPALQHALQTFAKPWHQLRAVRVFRDQTTMATTSELWPTIEAALLDSDYFLLLASPSAAQSEWVAKEVETWCAHRPARNLLIVLTDGEIAWDRLSNDFDWTKTTALPATLNRKFAHEPLYVDLRWARVEHLSPRHPQFLDAVASISCRLRGLSKDDVIGAEVRENRRTRRIVQVAIALLLTLAAGATYAAFTAQRALRVADERRIQARGVAETIIFEIDHQLTGVPEAVRVRQALSEKARGLLDVLGRSASSFDQRAARALLVQHSQRAELAQREGNMDGARKELETSLRLARDLAAYDPMNEDARRDISVCLSRLAELHSAAGNYDQARNYLEKDLELVRELLARDPTSFKHRLDLAVSLEKLGTLCTETGESDCAEPALDEDAKIMRELHAQFATNEETTRGLAIALTQQGEFFVTTARWQDARGLFSEAVTLQKQLGYDKTDDAVRARESSTSLLKLGDTYRQTGDDEQALDQFQQSLAIRRRLRDRSPNDGDVQRDLAVVLGRVADVYISLSDDASAVPPTKEAIAIFEALLAKKDDLGTRRELALNLNDLAGAQMRQNRFADASEPATKAVELLRQVHRGRPNDFSRPELFNALRRAGLNQDQVGDATNSRLLHAEACALMREVADASLEDDVLAELVLDLAQMSQAQAPHGPEGKELARTCAKDALKRLEQLKQQNRQVWNDPEIQEALEQMQRLASD